jgi:hypothetical protein
VSGGGVSARPPRASAAAAVASPPARGFVQPRTRAILLIRTFDAFSQRDILTWCRLIRGVRKPDRRGQSCVIYSSCWR